MKAPGLGSSQRAILETFKRHGSTTVPHLSEALGLNVETVRDHLRALTRRRLVRRAGSQRSGPGRPEIVYGLTPEAESLFPRREGDVLRELACFLRETENETLLREFFDRLIANRRAEALARVEGLEGRERLDEAALVMSELGFMAVVEQSESGPILRLCHCPLRDLVDVSAVPCRAEVGLVTALLGERSSRVSYIPSGDASCSYRLGVGE